MNPYSPKSAVALEPKTNYNGPTAQSEDLD